MSNDPFDDLVPLLFHNICSLPFIVTFITCNVLTANNVPCDDSLECEDGLDSDFTGTEEIECDTCLPGYWTANTISVFTLIIWLCCCMTSALFMTVPFCGKACIFTPFIFVGVLTGLFPLLPMCFVGIGILIRQFFKMFTFRSIEVDKPVADDWFNRPVADNPVLVKANNHDLERINQETDNYAEPGIYVDQKEPFVDYEQPQCIDGNFVDHSPWELAAESRAEGVAYHNPEDEGI